MLPFVMLSALTAPQFADEEGRLGRAALAPPYADPACCCSIGMAADATFPCRKTDSRASLTCFRFQLESSKTRSVIPASRHWLPAARSNFNVITYPRDPHLGTLTPFQPPQENHSLSSCATNKQADSKYHEDAGQVPEAWEPCLTQEPNRTQIGDVPENWRRAIYFCVTLAHTLYHVWEAVVHHKASRPSLRNPRPQLLINPALPRVQSNKPQPC